MSTAFPGTDKGAFCEVDAQVACEAGESGERLAAVCVRADIRGLLLLYGVGGLLAMACHRRWRSGRRNRGNRENCELVQHRAVRWQLTSGVQNIPLFLQRYDHPVTLIKRLPDDTGWRLRLHSRRCLERSQPSSLTAASGLQSCATATKLCPPGWFALVESWKQRGRTRR